MAFIALIYIFLKYAYPYDFQQNMFSPRAYYRETVARSKHFFAGYRTLSIITALLTLAMLLAVSHYETFIPFFRKTLLSVAILFLYLLVTTSFFQWKDKRFSRLNFLKFIYLTHAAFWIFPALFLSLPFFHHKQTVITLLTVIPLLFYFHYLPLEWKIAREELGLKRIANILYLCITEIIPVLGMVFVITDSL